MRALLVAAAFAASAAPAAAAAQGPDDGPTGRVELVSGDTVHGQLVRLFWRERAAPGAAVEGVVVARADGIELFVPRALMSSLQRYWVLRRLYFGTPGPHPVFNPKGTRHPEPVPAEILAYLADLAWRAGLETEARAHWEQHCKSTGHRSGYDAWLKQNRLYCSIIDGRWVDADTFHRERGDVKWNGRWVSAKNAKRLQQLASMAALRSVKGLVADPASYRRVSLGLVRSFPGRWLPARHGGTRPLVWFRAHFLTPPDTAFPAVRNTRFKPGAYLRLRVQFDDCAHVYLSAKNTALRGRAAAFSRGDPIVVYGRLFVAGGLILIECDALALR